MKRKLIGAALALLMSGGAAFAETRGNRPTEAQINSFAATMLAVFAGSRDHCPRFQLMGEAKNAELTAAGITPEMRDEMLRTVGQIIFLEYSDKYDKDPSAFCNDAWETLGPNGSYKRQMLEAK